MYELFNNFYTHMGSWNCWRRTRCEASYLYYDDGFITM